MNERIAYLSQIVDKIGAPLLLSILENAARSGNARNAEALKDEAQKLAELLSRAVMLSIDLGKMIEIERASPEHTESLRVAMAGLASPIVGQQYLRLKKPPAENDLKKVAGALEAVLTFAGNFSPSPENALRLNLLNASATPSDAHQITIQYLQAFVPVADVIAAFPFGQSEKKLIQDTAERINKRAKEMVDYIFGDTLAEEQKKLSELAFVKALAELYSSCHTYEMERLIAARENDPAIQQKSIEGIWNNFDTRAAMLETLAVSLTPSHTGRMRQAPQDIQEPAEQLPTSQTPSIPEYTAPPPTNVPIMMGPRDKDESSAIPLQTPFKIPTIQAQPTSPLLTQPEALPAQQSGSQPAGNPMAMSARPQQDKPEAQDMQTPAHPEPVQPPTPEQEASKEIPSSQPPPGSQASNPMAFFKIPPQDQQGE